MATDNEKKKKVFLSSDETLRVDDASIVLQDEFIAIIFIHDAEECEFDCVAK